MFYEEGTKHEIFHLCCVKKEQSKEFFYVVRFSYIFMSTVKPVFVRSVSTSAATVTKYSYPSFAGVVTS